MIFFKFSNDFIPKLFVFTTDTTLDCTDGSVLKDLRDVDSVSEGAPRKSDSVGENGVEKSSINADQEIYASAGPTESGKLCDDCEALDRNGL